MAKPSTKRQLNIWMNGELIGHWTVALPGRQEFRYAASWLAAPGARPLSLSMPLQPAELAYRDARVEAFFDNLLPDSPEIRRRAQMRFGAASSAAFDLLAEIGRDCVGAVQLLAPDVVPGNVRRIEGEPLTESGVANLLRAAVSAPSLGQREEDDFRLSIAGAQEKTALLWHAGRWQRPRGATPTTHIFKLPLGRIGNMQADMRLSAENEWLCGQILRAFGLRVAHSEMAQFEDQRVLIVERFDRRLAEDGSWWLRLPQEDMCQATGTPPARRYEADGGPGIQDIMALLLGARDANADRSSFFMAQILFWMLAAPDGHAKNFSVFIEPHGAFALTPFYDVISAYPVKGHGANQIAPERLRMAMAVRGKNRHALWSEIVGRHWRTTANASGVGSQVGQMIAKIAERTPAVVDEVARALPRDFPASVAEPIFNGLGRAAERLHESVKTAASARRASGDEVN